MPQSGRDHAVFISTLESGSGISRLRDPAFLVLCCGAGPYSLIYTKRCGTSSSPLSLCDIPTAIFFVKVEGDRGEDIRMCSLLNFTVSSFKF